MAGSTHDASEDGAAFYQLGKRSEEQGKLVDAVHAYKQALTAFRLSDNRQGEENTLCALGSVAEKQRLTQEAGQYYEQALAIDRSLGDRRWEAITLGLLSNVRVDEQRYDDAIRCLEESLAIAQEIGDTEIAGAAQNNLDALRRSRRTWLWRLLRLG